MPGIGPKAHRRCGCTANDRCRLGPARTWRSSRTNRAAVARFHAQGLAAGGRDNGKPGLRSEYSASYYAAFLLDPDGHNVEAVCFTCKCSNASCGWILIRIETVLCVKPVGLRGAAAYGGGHEHEVHPAS